MAAIGYAVLPVTVSIKGITGQLNKELAQPAQAAAKRASGNINKSLKAGVEDAAKAVENARKREEYATKAVVDAEKALQNARDTSEQKAKAVESAELKLKSARSGAQSKVADAEAKLTRLRESGKASAEQIESAERNLEQVRATQGSKVIDAENNLAKARTGARNAADSLAGAEEKVASKKTQAANASDAVIDATKRLDAAQDASAGSSGRFAQAMDRVKDSASKTGSAVAAAAEKYRMHAGVVVGAVGVLAKGAMDYASEAEQSYGAVEAVFADHAQGIIDHSKVAADAVGVSGREYRELSAYMGAMLKNLGLPMDEVAAKTEDLVGVGADLAATFGGTTKDAVEAIGAVMRGETDPIERYGVSIKEADIKAKAAAMGLGDLEGAAGKQAKAQAILALLTEQTSAAQGQFGRETDTAAHKQQVATAKLNDAKEAIGTGLLPIYAAFMDKLAGVSRLIGEHPKLFIVLGGAVAGLAGAVLTLGAVAPIFTAISVAAGAAGMSMWGYVAAQVAAVAPIAAVVAAVAAAGVALWAFFTKTETGKRVWDALVDAFKTGVGWIVEAFSWLVEAGKWLAESLMWAWGGIKQGWDLLSGAISFTWENVIKPVFNFFAEAAKILFAVVSTVLITPFILAWNVLSAAVKAGWEFVIKPAWDALQAAAVWMWNNVLMPVFGWIQNGWNLMVTGMRMYWETVLKPTWDALQFAAQWMWNNVLMPVFGFIKSGWDALVNAIKWAWENILKPTWDALGAALRWLNDTIIQPILQWIQDRWRQMADGIKWVRDNVIQPVFDALGRGLDTLKGWFETAVDAIGRTWNRVKELTAKPIKFVVDTVFNNGIRKAWNAVVGFIGMDDKKMNPVELGELGKYASGGVLPGYTPGRDVHNFVSPTGGRLALSGGEAIMRPEWTRAVGGPAAVEQMNRDARTGKISKHGRESAAFASGGVFDLGAFAGGGIIGAMTRIVQQKYPMLQMTSGLRPGDGGNHGAGLAADFSNGSGNTPAQLALARDIAKTYPNSMELIYDSPGWSNNIKNGANVGPFGQFYTWDQAGNHQHHVHWAMNTPPTMPFGGGVFEGGSDGSGGGGGFFDFIGKLVKPAWDKVINAIPKYTGSTGWAAETPAAFLKKGAGMVWDFVKEKASLFGGGGPGYSGPVGAGVEQWRGLVKNILKAKGLSLGYTDSTLRRMNQESGGNPRAINNWDSNAAAGTPSKGLMQVIDPTFAAHKDPGFNDIWDPESNIRASMNYALSRYGSLPAAYDRPGGYALGGVLPSDLSMKLYDNGGYLKPGEVGTNASGKPEPVFTAEQWAVLRGNILTNAQAQNWQGIAKDLKTIARGYQKWWATSDEAKKFTESAQKSAEDAAVSGAKSALAPYGLDPAVDIGLGVGKRVQSAWDASGMDVGVQGRSVVVNIEAEEGQDRITIDQLQKLEKEVDWLKVNVNRKPKASVTTRGGVM